MVPGAPERRSHDYVRAGTTTLFTVLIVATGKVIGSLHRRHRAAEFKKSLTKLDRKFSARLRVHLILDNYAIRKTSDIKRWLLAHPRFHLHKIEGIDTHNRPRRVQLKEGGVLEATVWRSHVSGEPPHGQSFRKSNTGLNLLRPFSP